MTVIVWIVEDTWPACVDAARAHTPDNADIVLLYVTDPGIPGAARGAYAGLLGRHHPERDPGIRTEDLAATSADQLLSAAAERLGRPCTQVSRIGRPEREVLTAADDADLLIVARDGDRTHPGPKSLGPAARFVVDHARCPVLLIWPEPAPHRTATPPPPPPHR